MVSKRSMSRSKILFLLLLVVALLAVALPAGACSCAMGDPRDMLDGSDGAIVGTYVSRRPADPSEEFGETIYTFEVDEEVKGHFDETLDVHSGSDGASCGFEIEPGTTIGMFLYLNEAGEWGSGLCSTISPRGLRDAAEPLPQPNGSGAARVVLAGSFGNARTLTLDQRSRTLDYGYGGDRDVSHLALCPGAARSVELTQFYDDRRDSWRMGIAVRNVRTQNEIRDFAVTKRFGQMWPAEIHCNDRRGREVHLFATEGYGAFPEGAIFVYRGRQRAQVRHVKAHTVTFGRDTAYMSTGKYGRNLVAFDLDADSKNALIRGPRPLQGLALSPDGTKLAGIQRGDCDDGCRGGKLVLVNVRSGRVRMEAVERLSDYAEVSWWGDRRFVVAGFARSSGTVRSFDLRFEPLGRFRDWYFYGSTVAGGSLYGVDYTTLYRARLPAGPIRKVRRLPSPVVNAIVPVPRR